jgi:hypothetical protein
MHKTIHVRDPVFLLNPQITGRPQPTPTSTLPTRLLFWDGRASGEFRDPITNQVVIP